MFRTTLFAGLMLATPLVAQMEMTDAEREAFRTEIRAYLLDNPEVLMEAIAILEQRQANAQAEADVAMLSTNAAALYEDDFSWVGGNPDGDITIVEFMDYRCSFCKRAYPEVEALIASDGNIRYIIKEFPILGEQSILASQFAVATKLVAGDEAYKDVHNTLMEYRGDVNGPALERIGETLGLDTAAILERAGTPEVMEIISRNRALGQRLAINGTPSFVIEDQLLRGYLTLEQMQQVVAQERG